MPQLNLATTPSGGTTKTDGSGATSGSSKTPDPSSLVWADNMIGWGPVQIHSRILKDVAVGAIAAVFLILGISFLAHEDIGAVVKSAVKVGEVA